MSESVLRVQPSIPNLYSCHTFDGMLFGRLGVWSQKRKDTYVK